MCKSCLLIYYLYNFPICVCVLIHILIIANHYATPIYHQLQKVLTILSDVKNSRCQDSVSSLHTATWTLGYYVVLVDVRIVSPVSILLPGP